MNKTIILWRRKRSRTFKQVGLATADGSAATIRAFWLQAVKGEGTLAIVDAADVAMARATIAAHLREPHLSAPGVILHGLDGRAFALGARAMLAVAGASEACRHWDARLHRDGKVKVQDTRALGERSDGVSFTTADAFGVGFKA